MHTIMVIGGGLLLLIAFVIAGRLIGGADGNGMAQAARWFILAWFVLAALNMYVGVSRAGYSIMDELPIFLIVFAVPAVTGWFAAMRLDD